MVVVPVHLRSILVNPQMNKLLLARVNELHRAELMGISNKGSDNVRQMIESMQQQLALMESIERVMKIKFVRLEEELKRQKLSVEKKRDEIKKKRKEHDTQHQRLMKTIKKDQQHLKEEAERTYQEGRKKIAEQEEQLNRIREKTEEMKRDIINSCKRTMKEFAVIARNA